MTQVPIRRNALTSPPGIEWLTIPYQRLTGFSIEDSIQLGRIVWVGASSIHLRLCQATHRCLMNGRMSISPA